METAHVHAQRHVVADDILQLFHDAQRVNWHAAAPGSPFRQFMALTAQIAEDQFHLRRHAHRSAKGFGHHVESGANIAHQLNVRAIAGVDIRRQHVDMYQFQPALAIPHAGIVFNWAITDADHQIGLLQ
ncbi:hypothetical protein D3C73_951080 [compost metagenome]